MKRITIIDNESLTPRRKSIFYIDELFSAGFDICFLDCSKIFRNGAVFPDIISEKYVLIIQTIKSLCSYIKQNNDSIYIVEIPNVFKNRIVFKTLFDENCKTVSMNLNASNQLISRYSVRNCFDYIYTRGLFNTFKFGMNTILYYFYKKIHKIKSYNEILATSIVCNPTHRLNSPDYEEYKFRQNKNIKLPFEKYIVFADVYFPLHSDLINKYKFNQQDVIDYRLSMNKLFALLEKKYDMPIVIAAHPKSMYSGKEFNGRKIIKYQTCELITNSQMVIMHGSNSVSYAVLSNKPILFVITNTFNKCKPIGNYIKRLALQLGVNVCDISKEMVDVSFNQISHNIRQKYIYSYLTELSIKDKTNKDIIINIISRM